MLGTSSHSCRISGGARHRNNVTTRLKTLPRVISSVLWRARKHRATYISPVRHKLAVSLPNRARACSHLLRAYAISYIDVERAPATYIASWPHHQRNVNARLLPTTGAYSINYRRRSSCRNSAFHRRWQRLYRCRYRRRISSIRVWRGRRRRVGIAVLMTARNGNVDNAVLAMTRGTPRG